jgi:hypothetical protein
VSTPGLCVTEHDLRRLALRCAGCGLGVGRVAGMLIVDHPDCCVEHRYGEHHRDQEPEQPDRPAVVLDDLPGLPRGQQESTGSNGEPSGGLITEAGQLLALSLVQLRERGLPEQPGPAAAQHVHDRRH